MTRQGEPCEDRATATALATDARRIADDVGQHDRAVGLDVGIGSLALALTVLADAVLALAKEIEAN